MYTPEKNKVLLFDLDGTLIDTGRGFQKALEDIGWELNPFDDMAHYYSGMGIQALLEHVLVDSSDIKAKIQTFMQSYHDGIEKYTFFYPGVLDAIEFFKNNNITWGIISNKEHAQCVKLCQIFGLEPDFLLGSGVINFTKPHPAPLLKAAQKLNVKAASCYYIGDMPTDIQAAERALMTPVYCQYGCYHYFDPCYTYARICKKFDDLFDVCNITGTTKNSGTTI